VHVRVCFLVSKTTKKESCFHSRHAFSRALRVVRSANHERKSCSKKYCAEVGDRF